MGDFVHLHLHSEYSLLDGACRIADIPKAAKNAGHSAVAITDHGVMYGVVDFYKACKAEGIKPIIGCEVYLAKRSRFDRDRNQDMQSSHLVLLVKNKIGWQNLIYLVSKGFTEGFYSKPRIDLELLRAHSDGLVCLSGCMSGQIPRYIVSGEYDKAEELAVKLRDIFGDGNFYLEIQDHGLRDDDLICDGLYSLSEKLSIPLVATNDVHYMRKSDFETENVLLCIQTGNTVESGTSFGFEKNEFYFKNTDEMERLFASHPSACANTQKIADMCEFDFEFGKTKLPRYTPDDGSNPADYLKSLAYNGLKRKTESGHIVYSELHPESEYLERVEYELGVIEKMGYSEYYLIVWDFVNHAKSVGIPVGPGRGSGAGSIVAYLVGITDIDSIKFDLLFERFLNPERVSMPDFDIDFCYDRRDEAIEYVRQKYGEDHTAQIVTFGTLAPRAAVRDVGRALGMAYNTVDEVAKLIPQQIGVTLSKAMEEEKLKELYNSDPEIRKLIDTASAIEGMPRHASTHAAGVVITEDPITSYVPVSVNGSVAVTQFDMDTIAELGLLKFDFLALRYLTIISNAEEQIKEKDPSFDIAKIDTNDRATYDMIGAGKSDGVFQLESGGMKQMLTQLKPSRFEDIIAAIALFRPGPMDSIPKYIEARNDPSKVKYSIPALKQILDVTYGCIVYQEQVMQIFREIAGYSFGHADVVRRAISKKKQHVLDGERQSFISGALERGVREEDAVALFEDIVSFANYAFNKSHAAAYAVLSFRTAYLKLHYPREYESALLTSVISSTDKLSEYVSDCKKHGIKMLPPDINKSAGAFKVEGESIRFGLYALKSVGGAIIDKLVAERVKNGPFADINDFLYRTRECDLNKRQLEVLIKSGALDSLGTERSRLLAVQDKLIQAQNTTVSGILEGQIGLFDNVPRTEIPNPTQIDFPLLEEFTAKEKLKLERDSCGMYLSGHILDDYKRHIEKLSPDQISLIKPTDTFDEDTAATEDQEVKKYVDNTSVIIVGNVVKRIDKNVKSGKMAFVTIEDYTSSIELLVFPKIAEKFGYLLFTESVVAVKGRISSRENEDVKIIAERVMLLIPDSQYTENTSQAEENTEKKKSALSTPPTKIFLRVSGRETGEYKRINAICRIFEGRLPAVIYLEDEKKYLPPLGINASEFVMSEIKEIIGEDNIVMRF